MRKFDFWSISDVSQVARFVLATVGNGQTRSGYGALSIWSPTKFERFLASELTQSALRENLYYVQGSPDSGF